MDRVKRWVVLLGAPLLLAAMLVACGSSEATILRATEPVPTATALSPSPTATALPTATPAPTPVPQETLGESPVELSERLATEAMSFLITFTEDLSPRASATGQERAAADFLAQEFEALGYRTELQPFTVNIASASLTAAGQDIQSIEMSMSGPGVANGNLVAVGRAFEGDIPEDGLTGAIALIERGDITFQEKVDRVAEAGALGAVVYNNAPGGFRGALSRRSDIPVVSISRQSGLEVLERTELGEVEATLVVSIETRDSQNVIAEKSGSVEDGGVVVLGGHYDTVPDVPGANDNGSGTATLVTVAREAADKVYPFTLRFIAFGSEETGLFGSRFYVDSLDSEERESVVAMLNFDALGTGGVVGVLGDTGPVAAVMDYGQDTGIPVERRFTLGNSSSDHASFQLAGIPVVFFLADDFSRIHTAEDRLPYIQPELMGQSATLAFGLLDHLSRK